MALYILFKGENRVNQTQYIDDICQQTKELGRDESNSLVIS